MHEEALLADLLRKLDEVARAQGTAHVARVQLWVGALSHFSEAGLRNRWALVTVGTVADRARLDVTVSSDLTDPRATQLVLESVDV